MEDQISVTLEDSKLGATPGVMGTLQVTEAVKVVLGIGQPVTNKLLVYDGEYMEFHEIDVKKNPDCPACGCK